MQGQNGIGRLAGYAGREFTVLGANVDFCATDGMIVTAGKPGRFVLRRVFPYMDALGSLVDAGAVSHALRIFRHKLQK